MQIKTVQGYENEVRRLLGAHEKEISAYALGLAGEAGEVVDLLKKSWGHGHPLDVEKLKKELGDCLWYVVALALQFGIPIDRITPRRLIDDTAPEHRGSRPLLIIRTVGRVCAMLQREWYEERGAFLYRASAEKVLTRDLKYIWDQLEQLGLEHGLTLGSILQANVDKLRLRYPDGFSTEASIARVDVDHHYVPGAVPVAEILRAEPTSAVNVAIDRFAGLRSAPVLDADGRDPIDAGREF